MQKWRKLTKCKQILHIFAIQKYIFKLATYLQVLIEKDERFHSTTEIKFSVYKNFGGQPKEFVFERRNM